MNNKVEIEKNTDVEEIVAIIIDNSESLIRGDSNIVVGDNNIVNRNVTRQNFILFSKFSIRHILSILSILFRNNQKQKETKYNEKTNSRKNNLY